MRNTNHSPERPEHLSDGFDAAIRESRRLRQEIGDTLETEREMARLRGSLGSRRRVRPVPPTDGGDDLTG